MSNLDFHIFAFPADHAYCEALRIFVVAKLAK